MKALQVWLPALGPSFGHPEVRRDAHRAYEAWRGEHTVFLVPGLEQTCRYSETDDSGGERRVLVIDAEHLDQLDVVHIGKNGYACGPAVDERFPNGQVAGLLTRCLSPDFPKTIDVSIPGVFGQLLVPVVRNGRVQGLDGRVVYEYKRFIEFGHVLPIESIDEAGSFTVRWPPRDLAYTPIEPDAELCEVAKNVGFDDLARRACFRWKPPFRRLFTFATGVDELLALTEMREIADLEDRVLALRRAREALSLFASEVASTVELVRFWPAYAQAFRPDEPLRPFWEEFGIEAATLEEARLAPQLRKPCKVLRVWGGLGLLWAPLVDALEDGAYFCMYCGARLRRQGRYCTRRDSPACFRQGRAADARLQRNPPGSVESLN
jgi:hypothetical protein